MPKILVVDDEKHIVELIRFNLSKEGWIVESALDGFTALDEAILGHPDIIVLDVMLPEMDGLEVCRRLKANEDTSHIPVIMLSAKSEELDKILGLEIGADDYMTKPFSPREMVARIKARLRRKDTTNGGDREKSEVIRVNHIVMEPEKFEVYINNVKQEFTFKEFELLKLMMVNRGKVFTREFLLERIWGYEYSYDTRTVDVHIRHLRQKIEIDPAKPGYIETIRGVGYKFRDKV